MQQLSLQEQYTPHSICFGCGPANTFGLGLQSYVEGDKVVAEWTPKPFHTAFKNILAGGVIGNLLDCHCNCTAAYQLMRHLGLEKPPTTVTAHYKVELHKPTPIERIQLVATLTQIRERRVKVSAQLLYDGQTYASCEGLFIMVKKGHPAFNAW